MWVPGAALRGCFVAGFFAVLAAGWVVVEGAAGEQGRRLQVQNRKAGWEWLASLPELPGREVLSSAHSWCVPGTVSPHNETCSEVWDAQALWVALADPNVSDIHIKRSLHLSTSNIPSGFVNRTADVRLIGAAPGVALNFSIPSLLDYTWLVMFGWLRFESLTVTGLMTMPLEVPAANSGGVALAQTAKAVFFPEMEARRLQRDSNFDSQGGFLTRFSGLVFVNVQTEFSYLLGDVLKAETMREFFQTAQTRGMAVHWPALPAPALVYRRKLVFMESFLQHIRMHNTTLVAAGNWPTADLGEAPLHSGTPQESCQTIIGGINGKDYVGDTSTAYDGSPCLHWAAIKLPGVDFSAVEGNYCRNPADHAGAWCFVESPYSIDVSSMYKPPDFNEDFGKILEGFTGNRFPFTWKYCDIPECKANTQQSCQSLQGLGEEYMGDIKTTADGEPCQLWNQTSFYDRGSVMEPFCRNPGSERDGVWCWTDSGNGKWGYCDVPICQESDASSNLRDILLGSVTTAVLSSAFGGVATMIILRIRRKKTNLTRPVDSLANGAGKLVHGPLDSCTSVTADLTYTASMAASRRSRFDAPRLDPNWVVIEPSETRERGSAMRDDSAIGERLYGCALPGHSFVKMPDVVSSSPEASGHVRLDSKLGVGTFGQVWKCRWEGQEAACKIVDMKGMQAVLRTQVAQSVEAVYMKDTVHPHLVRTLHVYHVISQQSLGASGVGYSRPDDGMELWIIQELCDMGDLAAYIKTSMLTPRDRHFYGTVLEILSEVQSALTFLHEQGIVHADLKLDNILLQKSSNCSKGFVCKVGDFGVSHSLSGRDYYYSTSMSGEARILAPEVLRSNRISAKMDTFSFGILMHELFCQPSQAQRRDTFPVICTKTLGGERPVFPADTPQAYTELARRCWLEDPEERPDDVSVKLELQALRCHAM